MTSTPPVTPPSVDPIAAKMSEASAKITPPVDPIAAKMSEASAIPVAEVASAAVPAAEVASATAPAAGDALNAAANNKGLISRAVTGLKEGVSANWSKPGFMGKAQVVVGGVMVADGIRRTISDIGSMMSSEKGVDKNGQPLPKPGIMNLAFNVGEMGLGALIAAKQFGRGK